MASASQSWILECYWPGVTVDSLREAVERIRAAVGELRRNGSDLTLRDTVLVRSDETVFCHFDGRETDVRAAGELAGLPFERVLETMAVAP